MTISSALRSHIDHFGLATGSAQLRGWIFHENAAIDRIDVTLQGSKWLEQIELFERPDVMTTFQPLIGARQHVARCGFDVQQPLPFNLENAPQTLIRVDAFSPDGSIVGCVLTHFCPDYNRLNASALPPVILQEHVGGSKDFVQAGVQLATLIMTYVGKYKPDFGTGNILDWGCGCGRVIAQLAKFIPQQQLHGCDVDGAAIEWARQNISGAIFTKVEPYPPTPYAGGAFDVVYGISVMTHLAEKAQILWLNELHRITRPGAIVLLSVIGDQLRKTNMPQSLHGEFSSKGFASFVPAYSGMLSEFVPVGYYQEAYHTIDYIVRTWSSYFEILEYVETKHQDLVILRRRA